MRPARLHLYKGERAAAELRKGRRVAWHAGRETRAGEIALFYEAAPVSGIVAVGRATGEPWRDRTWGLLISYERVMLPAPLPLSELRADPIAGRWGVWRMLSRTHVRIPPMTASAIAQLLVSRSAGLRPWLAPLFTESC
ncbi:MAG TPA: hypothetical protein VNM14_06880 [Planctomycetota bacterium]|nr:hypothetical protein [Planctomycetota bacterium]